MVYAGLELLILLPLPPEPTRGSVWFSGGVLKLLRLVLNLFYHMSHSMFIVTYQKLH